MKKTAKKTTTKKRELKVRADKSASIGVVGKFRVHRQNDLEFRMTSDQAIPITEGLAVMLRFIMAQCEQYDIDMDLLAGITASAETVEEKFTPIKAAQYGLS